MVELLGSIAIGAWLAFATIGLAHAERRGWFKLEWRRRPLFSMDDLS